MSFPIGRVTFKTTLQKIDEAKAIYEAGGSVADAAKHAGVTRQSMWKTLVRRGVKMRPHLRFGDSNHFYRDGQSRTPEKLRARKMVNKARKKKKNKLIPQPCERCQADVSLSQAHHDDYSSPLVVRWLCADCHRKEHGVQG